MNRQGTNQYQIKPKYNFWSSVWFIAFISTFGALSFKILEPKIISPLSENPIGAIVYANDVNIPIRDRVLIEGIKVFGADEKEALDKLIQGESSWNPNAINKTSGACGLFQAYPCSKLRCDLGDIGCQTRWGLAYIKKRYGSPTRAYDAWLRRYPHWY